MLRSCRLIDTHAETQTHAVQDLLNLVQRFAAEVLRLEHVLLGALHELADQYGVSAERIRQLEANAIKKLRKLVVGEEPATA